MGYSLVRWTIVLALLVGAFFAPNRALFSIMATAAPPTNEYPAAWAYEFYMSAGHFLALIAAAILVRSGCPTARITRVRVETRNENIKKLRVMRCPDGSFISIISIYRALRSSKQ